MGSDNVATDIRCIVFDADVGVSLGSISRTEVLGHEVFFTVQFYQVINCFPKLLH